MILALPSLAVQCVGWRLEKEWELRDLPGWFASCSLSVVAAQVSAPKQEMLSHKMQIIVLGVWSLTSTECSWRLSPWLPELCLLS